MMRVRRLLRVGLCMWVVRVCLLVLRGRMLLLLRVVLGKVMHVRRGR